MADRPIIFSGPMVRALLEGSKTQTRRVLKPQSDVEKIGAPYAVGDRLWVREAFFAHWGAPLSLNAHQIVDIDIPQKDGTLARSTRDDAIKVYYRADDDIAPDHRGWEPSIFMPRWASRLTLTVTDVRIQRVQEISEEDAKAEGAPEWWRCLPEDERAPLHTATGMFRALWGSLNAQRGFGWDANPWVVALTFDVVKANIDQAHEREFAATAGLAL